MCGRSFAARGVRQSPGMEEMKPGVQVAAAVSMLGVVALSGILLVAFAPGLWWVFTIYFWVAFPAFGLLARGVAGVPVERQKRPTEISGEQELLGALQERGWLTATGAAMHTSLSVAEADRMLGELANGGHLEVRARGGGLSYALWGAKENWEAEV